MSLPKQISVLIPCFNEAETINNVINQVGQELDKLGVAHEIIVIDDASDDSTRSQLLWRTDIKLQTNPYNMGYGASLKRGIRVATAGWLLIIDGDGTYPSAAIPSLLSHLDQADMVVGSRPAQNDHFGRRPAKWLLKKIAGWLAGRKIPDLNSGLRIFRKKMADEFIHLFPSGFSFTSTLTVAALVNDYVVNYLPIDYQRRDGRSGIRPRHFFDFLGLVLKLFIYFNPIKMMSPLAAVFFILGAIKLTKDVIVTGAIGTLAAMLILFAILIFFLALLSEVVIKRSQH